MTEIKIAIRNILRNVRRSNMTVSAIGVGALCLLLFGQFILKIVLSIETRVVSQVGHLSLCKSGYFELGAGNPSSYGIENYETMIHQLSQDPVIQPLLGVITPTVALFGIAGNFSIEKSKTFFGMGVVPSDFNKMRRWDEHHLRLDVRNPEPEINEKDSTHGIVGIGMARILGLCEALHLSKCSQKKESSLPILAKRDFSALAETKRMKDQGAPRLDLLAATAAGAPNVVSLYVDRAVVQGLKELDDSYIGMNLELAQQLAYGRGEKKATAIILQLHHTADMKRVRDHLESLIRKKYPDFEVHDLMEVAPFYKQALGMFSAIFGFIAVILVVIVLFTVVNTMSMSVLERTNEIGTLRALGVKKSGILRQFVLEGALLGLGGATLGIIVALVVGEVLNHAGLTWLPPLQPARVPLDVMNRGHTANLLLGGVWMGLVLLSTLAAWAPARQAARLKIVDALGHV